MSNWCYKIDPRIEAFRERLAHRTRLPALSWSHGRSRVLVKQEQSRRCKMEILCRRGANPLPGWPINRYLNYPITLSPSCRLSGPAILLWWCRSRSRSGRRRKTSSQLSLLNSRSFVSRLGCLASLVGYDRNLLKISVPSSFLALCVASSWPGFFCFLGLGILRLWWFTIRICQRCCFFYACFLCCWFSICFLLFLEFSKIAMSSEFVRKVQSRAGPRISKRRRPISL